MTITIKDIARIAGVSHSTVSRSLNDSPLVAENTKERIKDIAKGVGFEFNANARSLSTKKSRTIGIVYPENYEDFDIGLYYSSLMSSLRKILEREELDLIVTFPKNRYNGYSNIERLAKSKKIDGLIIVSPFIDDRDRKGISLLLEHKIPFVFVHHYPDDPSLLEKADVICTDHRYGGYLATEHLIKCGHKNIITITAENSLDEFIKRTQGYKQALNDYDIQQNDSMILYGDGTFKSGYDIIKQNTELIKKASAIFAQTDLMALGTIEALKELNIKVPEDIAVIGYDDIQLATFFKPNLTTIHQPTEQISELACETLINCFKYHKKKKKVIFVLPHLVIRDSCGARLKNMK